MSITMTQGFSNTYSDTSALVAQGNTAKNNMEILYRFDNMNSFVQSIVNNKAIPELTVLNDPLLLMPVIDSCITLDQKSYLTLAQVIETQDWRNNAADIQKTFESLVSDLDKKTKDIIHSMPPRTLLEINSPFGKETLTLVPFDPADVPKDPIMDPAHESQRYLSSVKDSIFSEFKSIELVTGKDGEWYFKCLQDNVNIFFPSQFVKERITLREATLIADAGTAPDMESVVPGINNPTVPPPAVPAPINQSTQNTYFNICKSAINSGSLDSVQELMKNAPICVAGLEQGFYGDVVNYALSKHHSDMALAIAKACAPEQLSGADPLLLKLALSADKTNNEFALRLIVGGIDVKSEPAMLFYEAAKNKDDTVIKMLIDKGGDINGQNHAALRACMDTKDIGSAKYLLEHGCDAAGFTKSVKGANITETDKVFLSELTAAWKSKQPVQKRTANLYEEARIKGIAEGKAEMLNVMFEGKLPSKAIENTARRAGISMEDLHRQRQAFEAGKHVVKGKGM